MKNQEDVLAHFGVAGMKWGQRKQEESAPLDQHTIQKNDRRTRQIQTGVVLGSLGMVAAGIFLKKRLSARNLRMVDIKRLKQIRIDRNARVADRLKNIEKSKVDRARNAAYDRVKKQSDDDFEQFLKERGQTGFNTFVKDLPTRNPSSVNLNNLNPTQRSGLNKALATKNPEEVNKWLRGHYNIPERTLV